MTIDKTVIPLLKVLTKLAHSSIGCNLFEAIFPSDSLPRAIAADKIDLNAPVC
jgi:hypothetical protein